MKIKDYVRGRKIYKQMFPVEIHYSLSFYTKMGLLLKIFVVAALVTVLHSAPVDDQSTTQDSVSGSTTNGQAPVPAVLSYKPKKDSSEESKESDESKDSNKRPTRDTHQTGSSTDTKDVKKSGVVTLPGKISTHEQANHPAAESRKTRETPERPTRERRPETAVVHPGKLPEPQTHQAADSRKTRETPPTHDRQPSGPVTLPGKIDPNRKTRETPRDPPTHDRKPARPVTLPAKIDPNRKTRETPRNPPTHDRKPARPVTLPAKIDPNRKTRETPRNPPTHDRKPSGAVTLPGKIDPNRKTRDTHHQGQGGSSHVGNSRPQTLPAHINTQAKPSNNGFTVSKH